MRPPPSSSPILPANSGPSRSRKGSGQPPEPVNHPGPMTFFSLRTESEMEAAMERRGSLRSNTSSRRSSGGHANKKEGADESKRRESTSGSAVRDSTYGVQSLADTISALDVERGSEGFEASRARQGSTSSGSPAPAPRKRKIGDDGAERSRVASIVSELNALSSADASPIISAGPSTKSTSPARDSPTLEMKHTRRDTTRTLTPLRLASPAPDDMTLPNTPKSFLSLKSFRLSDEDEDAEETGSQAITSGGEEDNEDEQQRPRKLSGLGLQNELGESEPQLVMPSIQMPDRRPFTERGKRMGRLKLMVAGEAGIGKSSLIRSIIQICQDIVHVDPLSQQTPSLQNPQVEKRKGKPQSKKEGKKNVKDSSNRTPYIQELNASTKAYPQWWSEMDDSKVLRRRRSQGDTVLERNVCFIDTPGHSNESAAAMDTVVQYTEALMHRNATIANMGDNELLSILSGGGGVQVDAVLYVFGHKGSLNADIDNVRRLSGLTNVIPVIGKSDLLSPEDVASLKATINSSLKSSSVKPFLFGSSLDDMTTSTSLESSTDKATTPTTSRILTRSIPAPFAVSSAASDDKETLDASILMSPDYQQPLVASDLPTLVHLLFDPENIPWIRHASAKKFISWRSSQAQLSMYMGQPHPTSPPHPPHPSSPSFSTSGVLIPYGTPFSPLGSPSLSPISAAPSPPNFQLSRFLDHAQREERLAQVRLAKWAGELQESMRRERERYERLSVGERKGWLLEQCDGLDLGSKEQEQEQALVRCGAGEEKWQVERRKRLEGLLGRSGNGGRWQRGDPLGLLGVSERVRRRLGVFVRVLGGVGVLGAVVVWVVRGMDLGVVEWWGEWFGAGGSQGQQVQMGMPADVRGGSASGWFEWW